MKMILCLLLFLTSFSTALAVGGPPTSYQVNNFGDKYTQTILGGTQVTTVRFKVTYQDLNTAGTGVRLNLGTQIPSGAVVKQVYYVVTTTFADNGTAGNADTSTISLGLNSNVDLKAAIAISDGTNPWDAGIKAGIPVNTVATMVAATAARYVGIVWTDGSGDSTALTAGVMDIYVDFVFPTP